jgi:hypothetical protein
LALASGAAVSVTNCLSKPLIALNIGVRQVAPLVHQPSKPLDFEGVGMV